MLYVGGSAPRISAICLTDREQGHELRSAFGFNMRLDCLNVTDLSLRTGSSTRNEVGFTEKPASSLQIKISLSIISRVGLQ
jgi:hypothetical protein